jgi:deazaflavin-dependent oxidoreductase (nitroreductase family)
MTDHDSQPEQQTGIRIPHPKGVMRLALRAPILLYRMHLSFLLGKRFAYLEHRGRRTGMIRGVVIEIVDYDPQERTVVVVAAWGKKADWYKNVLADPQVTITVGSDRYPAIARTLSRAEAERHLEAYARHHPGALRELDMLVEGAGKREAEQIIQTFLDTMPVVEFSPMRSNGADGERKSG